MSLSGNTLFASYANDFRPVLVYLWDAASGHRPVTQADLGGITTLGASEAHLGEVGGRLAEATYEFNRPSDTNAYAGFDVVADSTTAPNPIVFSGMGRTAGGGGYITKFILNTNASKNPRFRLWLFNVAPSGIPDNTGHALLYAERASRVGYIDNLSQLSGVTVYNVGSTYVADTPRLAYICSSTGTHLYGMLQTLDNFTGLSAQSFSLKLVADQN